MEYEKKYKEALKWVQKLYPSFEGWVKEDAEHYFPELKSEDEKIRKAIHIYLDWLDGRKDYAPKGDYTIRDMIAWLEKQKPNTNKREIDDAYLQGICDAKHAIEKQGESPRTNIEIPFGANDSELQEVSYDIPEGFNAEIKDDRVVIKKIERKCKAGDWVILNGTVAKILDKQKYGFVGLDIDGKDFFCNYGHTDSMHLWTINDAKDGDVLASKDGDDILIFRNIDTSVSFSSYYNIVRKGESNWDNTRFFPATKEQHDLLFAKMKDSGYEWDANKKELKKIEHTLNADKVIGWLVANICEFDYYVKRFKQDFGL